MGRIAICFVVIAGCASSGSTQRTSSIDGVPEAVARTIREHAGDAEVKVGRDGDAYEATWWEDELEREATVAPDGRLVELEVEVRSADVPIAVRDAVAAKLEGASKLTWVQRGDGRYEVEARVGTEDREIILDANGHIVASDDELDEVDEHEDLDDDRHDDHD